MKLRIKAYNCWDISYFVCPNGQVYRSVEGFPPTNWSALPQECEWVPWVGF